MPAYSLRGVGFYESSLGAAPAVAMYSDEVSILDALLGGTPLARHGQPEDIAAAIAFLLSDDSGWIAGQILSVNGGQSFRD